MKKCKHLYISLLCGLLMCLLALPASAATGVNVTVHSQDEILSFLSSHPSSPDEPITYEVEPVLTAPYEAGKLSESTQTSAINMINQMRYIAGVSSNITLDEGYNEKCQAGSLVNAVNNDLSHTPEKPADMSDELYSLGYSGTNSSNIASGYTGLSRAVVYGWMADEDESNIPYLGHRNWLLNPKMGKTGLGAVGKYSSMYSIDYSGSGTQSGVVWPAQTMPLEYFKTNYPWSFNLYGSALAKNRVSVSLVREADSRTWNFSSGSADGYFGINAGCVIFRPDGITSFASDDVFHVVIKNGTNVLAQYDVNFFSLNPVTSITLSKEEISLEHVGDSQSLSVNKVLPSGASTGFIWTSSDESVAKVVPGGAGSNIAKVTGTGVGTVTITATSTNGKVQAVCKVSVHEFEEKGLTEDKTQLMYVCADCGEVMYKNVITDIGQVFWRVGGSGYFRGRLIDEIKVGTDFEFETPYVAPANHEDEVVVTTDREDIVTFTRDTRYLYDVVFASVPQRAGWVEITISSKLNPDVKKIFTYYVEGPLVADPMTVSTEADTEKGGVCGVPVSLEVQAAGGKLPYTITYTAVKEDGSEVQIEEKVINENDLSAPVSWIPTAAGVYTLKAHITDAEGTALDETVEQFSVRKAAVTERADAQVAFADQHAALIYGQPLRALALNTETAIFVGENGETVPGTLAWNDADHLPDAGEHEFSWSFVPENEDAYERCSGVLMTSVRKAVPEITLQEVSLSNDHYDSERTLADEQISGSARILYNGEMKAIEGSFVWADETAVPLAGTYPYAVQFIPADSENIAEAASEISLTLQKAQPMLHEAQESKIHELTYGEALSAKSAEVFSVYEKESSQSALRGAYAWAAADTIPAVKDSMTTAYAVTFTPDDPNFEVFTGNVLVRVNKAETTTRPEAEIAVPYAVKTAGSITLPEGWTLSEQDAVKELAVGTPLSVTAYYEDQDNYLDPTQTILITRQPCEHPTTEARTITAPTCTEEGLEKTYCTICEEELSERALPALGHTPETDAAVEPTCTETGLTEGSHCSVCGEILVKQEIVEAKGHVEEVDAAKEPTCTETGLTEGSHCSVCGEVLVKQETVEAKGHVEETDAAKEPTCTETGLTEGSHCSVCSEVLVKQEIVPAKGHREEVLPGREATETETGLTEGKRCTVCGEITQAQQEIPKKTVQQENPGKTDPQTGETDPAGPGSVPQVVTGEVSPANPVSSEAMVNQVLSARNDNDQKGSGFALLQAKGTAASATAVKLTWKRVPTADAYMILGNKCGKGKTYQPIATVKKTSFTQKKLKKGTYYKYLVIAVSGDRALAVSKTIHVATKGGKVGNARSVTVNKNTVTLKVNKTGKIKGKAIAQSSRLKMKKHRALSYESSNPAIATVSSKGVIKGVAKGTCYVYVYAQNGVSRRIRVKVR